MPTYTPPLRDMQFVLHELFKVSDEFKALPKHAETDVDTIQVAHCGFDVAPADVGHQLPDIPPARTCPLGKSPA